MDKLSNYLVKNILTEEDKPEIKRTIAIYPGRFQPFGKHHAAVFKWVQDKFGKDNSYIATSDKVELPKSPFSFNDKKKIINKYGYKNVVQVKNPYIAKEITDKFDPETTAVVFVVGGKEENRIKPGKYFKKWEGKAEHGFGENGYFVESPVMKLKVPGYGEMSGTTIRKSLGNHNIDDDERMDLFKGIFGHTDKTIYKLVTDKLLELNEVMIDFVIRNKLYETTTTLAGGQEVDDGPKGYWGNEHSYRNRGDFEAGKLGMEVLNYLTGQDLSHIYGKYDTDYPNGPVDAVSYFPAGDIDSVGAGTQYVELQGNPAYEAWLKHIEKVALRLGYTFVHDLKTKELSVKGSENEPMKKKDKEKKTIDLEDQHTSEMLEETVIKENPDVVFIDGKEEATYPDSDSRAFGYYNGKMFVSTYRASHGAMDKGNEKYKNFFDNMEVRPRRSMFKFAGRIWDKTKIISFWKYPPKGKFKKLITDLEKESGTKIWGKGWQVEVYPGKKDIDNADQDGSVLIPLEKYNGSKLPPGGDVDHAKSPLLKKKKQVPTGIGSKKKPLGYKKGEVPAQTHARMRMDWWNKEELEESPDTAHKGGKKLYYRDEQAKPFAYFNGEFVVGDFGEGHTDVEGRLQAYNRKNDGRIWTKDKVISFWDYPKQSELKNIIKMIEKQSGIKIWNNKWWIEVSSDETGHIDIHRTEKFGTIGKIPVLIPVEDYSDKDEIQFDKTAHIASPMLKKKLSVPKGVGSKKTPLGHKKGEVPAQTHARMRMDHIEVDESINIDVEVGDTIMTGRFKNSPTVVKTIGKDEYGMPTINGKKVVTFKKGKKKPNIFDENLFTKDWWDILLEDFTE